MVRVSKKHPDKAAAKADKDGRTGTDGGEEPPAKSAEEPKNKDSIGVGDVPSVGSRHGPPHDPLPKDRTKPGNTMGGKVAMEAGVSIVHANEEESPRHKKEKPQR